MKSGAAWLVAPQMIITAALVLVPIGHTVVMACGGGQFARLFTDPAFWGALRNTGLFVAFVVPTQTLLAFLIGAWIVETRRYGMRALFYFPEVTSGVVLAIVMRRLISPITGVFPIQVLTGVGAVGVLSAAVFLISFGTPLLIYVSAIKAIPREVIEAAQLDGAGAFVIRWRMVFPAVAHTTYLVLVLKTIAVSQAWVVVHLITGGGPARSTETLSYQIYHEAFVRGDFNYASALAVVLTVLILAMSWVQRRVAA